MSRGYLRTLEAFLAVSILLFALYQFQINIPTKIPVDYGNLRLKEIAEDIKNIYCYSTTSREDMVINNKLRRMTLFLPPDIDFNITLFDENWNILDQIGNTTSSEKVTTVCMITGYIQGNRTSTGIRYVRVEVWFR